MENKKNHILMETPSYEGGKDWYDRMTKKHPNNFKLAYGLALSKHNNNDLVDALADYKKIIQLKPDFSKAYCMAAFIESSI